jgi:enoyl-CoA hydratase
MTPAAAAGAPFRPPPRLLKFRFHPSHNFASPRRHGAGHPEPRMNLTVVKYEAAEGIATITVNRPDKLNALNKTVMTELEQAFDAATADAGIGAIIVTGEGPKSFVAGADIAELNVQTPLSAKDHSQFGQQILHKLERSGKPVIAAINGFALGGGCELAMACHIRYASDNAKLGQPEVNLGIIAGYMGTQRLPRLVGKGIALELLLSAELITAQRAAEIGLVNKVVPQAELMNECRKLAKTIMGKGPLAVKYTIEAVNEGLEMELEDGGFYESTLFGLIAASEDMKEGTKAFLEKRKAEFKNR